MTDDRLPTSLWMEIQLRHLTAAGVAYYIHNKGAPASGTIMVKLNNRQDGCLVLQQQRDLNGEMGWMKLLKGQVVPEGEADALIARAIDRDPDIWVIEVEDKDLKNPFEGKVF